MSETPAVLILSGVDPTNGAGLGRDILTVRELGCYPLSIPTVLTVQNSMRFDSSKAVEIEYIRHSIDLLNEEFSIKAVKTGLVPTDEKWIEIFAEILENFSVPIVIDTVVKATTDSTERTIPEGYLKLLTGSNRIIKPNLNELKMLHQLVFSHENSPETMARNISEKFGCTVLTTFEGRKDHILLTSQDYVEKIDLEIINSNNSYHGTGCTFSSALASFLAKGHSLQNSVNEAAAYTSLKISGAVRFSDKGQHFLY